MEFFRGCPFLSPERILLVQLKELGEAAEF